MNFKKIIVISFCISKFVLGSDTSETNLEKSPYPSSRLHQEVLTKFNSSMERVALNVANLFMMPKIQEILKFYKNNCKCSEDAEPFIFRQYIESEFKNKANGQILNDILEYYEQDQQGIVSDFGLELQNAGLEKAKKLQNYILNLNIPPFSLSSLRVYEPLIEKIKKDFPKISFDDQLLCFASHLFHAIPWAQRQHFSSDVLKKSAIGQIYKEFDWFFERNFKFNNDAQKIEKFNRFLTVIQYLLHQNQFQRLYTVTVTKGHVYFNTNDKTENATMREVVSTFQALELQPNLKLWQAQRFQRAVVNAPKERNSQEIFDDQVKVWEESYQEMNKEWDHEYTTAFRAVESAQLIVEIEKQEELERQAKLKKQEELEKQRQQAIESQQASSKILKETIQSSTDQPFLSKKQIKQNRIDQMKKDIIQARLDFRCFESDYDKKWEIFDKEWQAFCEAEEQRFAEIRKIKDVQAKNQSIFETIQSKKYQRVVTQIQQKNELSLGIVQRFAMNQLLKLRRARQEIEQIKTQQYEPSPLIVPQLSQITTASPANVLESRMIVEHNHEDPASIQPAQHSMQASVGTQRVSHNPYPSLVDWQRICLQNGTTELDSYIDEGSNESSDSYEPQNSRMSGAWIQCGDGSLVYYWGNGSAQDAQGYWYAYNPITHSWDIQN